MKGWKQTLVAALLLTVVLLAGCGSSSDKQPPGDPAPAPSAAAASFAAWQEPKVDVQPAVPAYRVAADLSNVTNAGRFDFSSAARELLTRNGFVVVPSERDYSEFFWLYEMNSYEDTPIPNFVTTDAMLHNYHLYFSHLLRTLEKDQLRSTLQTLTTSMLTGSEEHYRQLKGTAWENAARRNTAYFAVAARLLDPAAKVPSSVKNEVEQELALISAHSATCPSPVMNMGAAQPLDEMTAFKEDYTQYIPRGHYDRSNDLSTYFKTMMWYGRMTFRAANEDETRSAALAALLLRDQERFDQWNRIYEPTGFFVGHSDDLGYYQYAPLLAEHFGEAATLKELTGDEAKWEAFLAAAAKLDPPAINSVPIFDETIQPDRGREIKGFRFMGQRFTLDASIFQRLIYREVKENRAGETRMLPKGLDIPAAMGSKEAYAILDAMGETEYKNYPENMRKMREGIAALDQGTWTQNLYWCWLHTLQPLTAPKGEGFPSFMRNDAWTRKQLATYLSSWTELKHDTILYAKQVYAECGGGGGPVDDRGYVEPQPTVFGRLAALTRMTIDGLAERDLLNVRDRDSLERMEKLALSLKTIAEKELAVQSLTDEEYDLIRSFGGQLEHFWLEALRDEGVDHRSATFENPAALVADVATAPPDTVLEEATGQVQEIYAVVPVDGKLRIAKGAVYSYYEFPWPAGDRLTDKKWQGMLREGQVPDQPAWTQAFTAR